MTPSCGRIVVYEMYKLELLRETRLRLVEFSETVLILYKTRRISKIILSLEFS